MIDLYERRAKKIPALTSLYFTLTSYSKELFNSVVQMQNVDYNKTDRTFEIPVNRLEFVLNALCKYDDVCVHPYEEEKAVLTVPVDKSNFKASLYSHQIEAINYGLCHDGWMLLDDCGLGKTLTMICLAEELSRRENLEHCLILCGINSLKFTWAEEIKKFSDKSCTILGQYTTKTGKTRIASVEERCNMLKDKIDEFFVITNIETLQSKEFLKAYRKSKNKFDMIVLDEAHHCKNSNSLSGSHLLKLTAKRCIALTGTLIMNRPENAFVPLKWTGNTQSNMTEFKNMFHVKGGYGGVQVIGYKNLNLLKDLIDSCSLRRLKEDILDLPEKTYLTEYVEMGKQQQDLYEEVQAGVLHELDLLDHTPTVMEEMTINMRLRQITAYPGMISSNCTQSAKLERAEELIDEITAQGDKVVVFCTFKGTAYELGSRLENYGALVCTGDQSDEEVQSAKDQFSSDDDTKVLVCTWQKMGTGHTLTSANYAIFIDTPWTDADFKQSADRIYRIGQNKKVFIITLITKNTYDERVQEILNMKESLSSFVVDDKYASILKEWG